MPHRAHADGHATDGALGAALAHANAHTLAGRLPNGAVRLAAALTVAEALDPAPAWYGDVISVNQEWVRLRGVTVLE